MKGDVVDPWSEKVRADLSVGIVKQRSACATHFGPSSQRVYRVVSTLHPRAARFVPTSNAFYPDLRRGI